MMVVFKCKMCGGNLEVQSGATVCKCEYCASVQTVPKLDDEKKNSLFSRAHRLRSSCEFDKAFGIYESIITEFPEEAEAYWGLVLCKYGIEYVDDPVTGGKIPTCHRSSFVSVFDDPNFDMVMEYSDPVSKKVYRDEAKAIERLRIDIIEVSAKEEPYDIFICYKETDALGERTVDSVIAQDAYDALVEKGYRVFFSRITLEDKIGQEYEPYIFAALSSAKVMLVFGTDYEYFNAVWVKNEWSRFLGLIEKGEKKTLIPCYKGIEVYDMPREFARLQAQDMGKIGAMQDLLRGVGKIIGIKTSVNVDNAHMEGVEREPSALAQRGNMALEDGDFSGADEYFERALDANPADAYAYLGKFLVKYQFSSLDDFENKVCRLEESKEFKRAEQFADIVLAKKLKSFRELNEIKIERMHLIDVLKKISQKKIEEEPLRLMREAEKLRQQEMIQRAAYDEACARVKSRISYEAAPYIARLEEEFDAKIKDVQRKIEEEISVNKGARDSFADEISNLYNQKASLGLFKGKEKKAIQIKIDEIQNKMNQIESESQVQNKYQNQLNQINREKRAEVNKITADIGAKYTMPKFEDFADYERN